MHSTEAARVDEVNIRPYGYQWSVPISLPKLYDSQDPRPASLPSAEARSVFILEDISHLQACDLSRASTDSNMLRRLKDLDHSALRWVRVYAQDCQF